MSVGAWFICARTLEIAISCSLTISCMLIVTRAIVTCLDYGASATDGSRDRSVPVPSYNGSFSWSTSVPVMFPCHVSSVPHSQPLRFGVQPPGSMDSSRLAEVVAQSIHASSSFVKETVCATAAHCKHQKDTTFQFCVSAAEEISIGSCS